MTETIEIRTLLMSLGIGAKIPWIPIHHLCGYPDP